jgi:hypothetical protein
MENEFKRMADEKRYMVKKSPVQAKCLQIKFENSTQIAQ